MDLALRRARLAVTITFIVNGFTAGTFVARIPDFKKILENEIIEISDMNGQSQRFNIDENIIFDYTFKRGERIGIIGKNGVGKSTFLNLIQGLEEADSGKINVGDTVKVGQTLCIIEAMKLLNEIESEKAGVVKQILCENGQGVEFDQPLFIIA